MLIQGSNNAVILVSVYFITISSYFVSLFRFKIFSFAEILKRYLLCFLENMLKFHQLIAFSLALIKTHNTTLLIMFSRHTNESHSARCAL